MSTSAAAGRQGPNSKTRKRDRSNGSPPDDRKPRQIEPNANDKKSPFHVACDPCRVYQKRCSKDGPPCERCVERGIVEQCVYNHRRAPGRPLAETLLGSTRQESVSLESGAAGAVSEPAAVPQRRTSLQSRPSVPSSESMDGVAMRSHGGGPTQAQWSFFAQHPNFAATHASPTQVDSRVYVAPPLTLGFAPHRELPPLSSAVQTRFLATPASPSEHHGPHAQLARGPFSNPGPLIGPYPSSVRGPHEASVYPPPAYDYGNPRTAHYHKTYMSPMPIEPPFMQQPARIGRTGPPPSETSVQRLRAAHRHLTEVLNVLPHHPAVSDAHVELACGRIESVAHEIQSILNQHPSANI